MATPAVEAGRDAYHRRAWREAYQRLSEAATLEVEDLEHLAVAGHLLGTGDWADLWTRAHEESLAAGDVPRAARCAFWLSFGLIDRGEFARGGGWLAVAQKLVEELDCVERGYLLIPLAIRTFGEDPGAALKKFEAAGDIGDRFGDSGLTALSHMGQGQALIALGRWAEAVPLLDAAMVAVGRHNLPPLVAGNVLCGAIDACQAIFDVGRAREWTIALNLWCDSQSDLVPFRGECLAHRAEVMQLHGDWLDAADEADRARHLLEGRAAVGEGHYRVGELHRLRGQLGQAEEAYRAASHAGREPQPGLAQLRLAEGHVETAVASIRRALDETSGAAARAKILIAYVEIMLATDDIAAAIDSRFVRAAAAAAEGAVLLADGQPTAALPSLRRAWTAWRSLEIPYEAARVRALIGRACLALGDQDGASLELDAARLGFECLGAVTELAGVETLLSARRTDHRGLTSRELEVLTLAAKGSSNREIATLLVISEHTVARHVQNILAKLGVSSRTAASAYAFEHRLVSPR